MAKKGLLIIIALHIITICNSCKPENTDYNVFKYNLVTHPNSLDPAFAKSLASGWICSHIFNTLVETDENSNIASSVAKTYEISEDGKTYTFQLRNDVFFHKHPLFGKDSTRTINAHDVAFSLSRIINEEVNSPGSWIFENKVSQTDPFVALNDSTFQISLLEPFRPLLSILTMPYCSIVPKEIVESLGDEWKNNPVGSGPFVFKKWIKNQNLFLLNNHDYWRDLGNLDGIKVNFIVDHKIAFLELLNGNLDLVSGLESSFINEMLTPDGELREKHNDMLNYLKSPFLNSEYIGINTKSLAADHPLRNIDFRKALNYAIDKDLMLSSLRNNVGFPAHAGFAPKGLSSFSDSLKGYKYDLSQAKYHLEKSKVDVQNMPILELNTNPPYADIMLFVSKQWEKIGIKSKVEVMESSILREGMRAERLGLFRASWVGDYVDTENYMSVFHGDNGAPPNYTGFSNKEFDELYAKTNTEADDKRRNELFQNMEQIIIAECPMIFLFYDQSSNFYNDRISGVFHHLNNQPFLENLNKN